MQNHAVVQNAAGFLSDKLGALPKETVGVILGTGLGGWLADHGHRVCIPYTDIPDFPVSTVLSHCGALYALNVEDRRVLVFSGRFHLYEGYTPAQVCLPARVLAALGLKKLAITNAAGALAPSFDTGSLMLITDHINFTGRSPLTGPNVESWGPRFPDMSRPYDPEFIRLALETAAGHGIRLERGVYIQIPGPQMETPAETRAYRNLGADAIGMSTALEVIAARHMGLRVLGISCLTNKNLPDCMEPASLEDVIAQAEAASGRLGRLLDALLPRM
jgi:purine-nucleoside phosphorylase